MAARYFINGGVNSNWSTSGNWSATDGGGASGVKPTAADDVFFTANSPNCTVDTAGVGLTLNFTGYASTITMTAGLTISGSVTLVAAMTIAGTSGLTLAYTSTLTSNGKTWPNDLWLDSAGNKIITLADNLVVGGTLKIGAGGLNSTINGAFTITCSGGLTQNQSSSNAANGGTCSGIIMNGSGTVTGPSGGTGWLAIPLTINTSGTITFSNNFGVGGSTLTYVAGTVVTTGSTLYIADIGTGATLDTNGIIWNNVSVNINNKTLTLTSNLTLTGLLSLGAGSGGNLVIMNGSTVNTGGLTLSGSGAGAIMSGTTNIVLTGTGTVTGNTTAVLKNNLTINTAGTVTFASGGTLLYNTGTLTYTAGTVVATNHNLYCRLSTAFATNGMTLGNVLFDSGTPTMTFSNAFSLAGLLTVGTSSNAFTLTGSQINAGGGVRYNGSTGVIQGTTVINVNGTGTLDGPSATTGYINNPITINAPGGTVTIATAGDTPFKILLDKFTYLAGTVVTDRGTWSTP